MISLIKAIERRILDKDLPTYVSWLQSLGWKQLSDKLWFYGTDTFAHTFYAAIGAQADLMAFKKLTEAGWYVTHRHAYPPGSWSNEPDQGFMFQKEKRKSIQIALQVIGSEFV